MMLRPPVLKSIPIDEFLETFILSPFGLAIPRKLDVNGVLLELRGDVPDSGDFVLVPSIAAARELGLVYEVVEARPEEETPTITTLEEPVSLEEFLGLEEEEKEETVNVEDFLRKHLDEKFLPLVSKHIFYTKLFARKAHLDEKDVLMTSANSRELAERRAIENWILSSLSSVYKEIDTALLQVDEESLPAIDGLVLRREDGVLEEVSIESFEEYLEPELKDSGIYGLKLRKNEKNYDILSVKVREKEILVEPYRPTFDSVGFIYTTSDETRLSMFPVYDVPYITKQRKKQMFIRELADDIYLVTINKRGVHFNEFWSVVTNDPDKFKSELDDEEKPKQEKEGINKLTTIVQNKENFLNATNLFTFLELTSLLTEVPYFEVLALGKFFEEFDEPVVNTLGKELGYLVVGPQMLYSGVLYNALIAIGFRARASNKLPTSKGNLAEIFETENEKSLDKKRKIANLGPEFKVLLELDELNGIVHLQPMKQTEGACAIPKFNEEIKPLLEDLYEAKTGMLFFVHPTYLHKGKEVMNSFEMIVFMRKLLREKRTPKIVKTKGPFSAVEYNGKNGIVIPAEVI